ncbi:MAG: LysR family transcriptional regulator [Woeseiaceae bacterium]|nr:LysR family transcriptional regulator [Woeseiaceae bacterium]
MNWDDVRYFLALCREGSVSSAGRRLGVNHTTVARRVAAFEAELGTRLFDRTRDGYAMTQAAENMYAQALDMEEQALAIDRAMAGRDAELEGRLKITVPYDFANRIVAPALPRFRAEFPCIELELLTTTGLVDLAAREADIAVRLTGKPPEYLVGRQVLPLRHGVYGAPVYLGAAHDKPDVILFRSDKEMPPWVEENFPGARIAARTDNLSTMHACVRAGLGLARMPCYEADAEPGLERVDVPLTPSKWGVWILNHVDLRSTARVRVAREFLIDVIEANSDLILGRR